MFKRKIKVPEVLQNEACECGAASLSMILGYYGRYEQLIDIRRACNVSRDGCNVFDIVSAAETYGLKADAFMTSPGLIGIRMPCIVFWRGYHFVVVEQMTADAVLLCDPAVGHRKVTLDEFKRDFTGVAITFEPGEKFTKKGKPFSALAYILKHIEDSKGLMLFIGMIVLLSHFIGIMVPKMENIYIDRLMQSYSSKGMEMYFPLFLLLIFLQLLIPEFQHRMLLKFERFKSAQLTKKVIKKFLFLPYDYFQKRNHSTIESKLMSINDLTDFMSGKLVTTIFELLFSAVYLIMLFQYNVIIALIILLIIAIIMLLTRFLMRDFRNLCVRGKNAMSAFYSEIYQDVRLFDTIKSSAREDAVMVTAMSSYNGYENVLQSAKKILAIVQVFPLVSPIILQITVVLTGVVLMGNGMVSPGRIIACQSLAVMLFVPINSFFMNWYDFQNNIAIIGAIRDVEEEEIDKLSCRNSGEYDCKLKGKVELEGVSFGYNPAKPPIIRNINLSVMPGTSIALVGSSGSGKSTTLKLLEGLYQPWEGRVLLDGKELGDTNRLQCADSISIVSQDSSVIYGTVGENITFLDSRITMSEMIEAARGASIYDDIMSRREGFDEILDPLSLNFSGGQVQRLMIARALAKNPSVLIMDEATSALDTVVEKEIIDNLKKKKMTVIIVAHRLSTIRDCDQILVFDKGEIAERGRHEELMKLENGIYRRLVASGESTSHGQI